MFCPSCGLALAHQTKYCNRCGAHLASRDPEAIKLFENRMDSEMEGLFWSTMMGLGLVLGGLVVLKKIELGNSFILAWMILSSAAFITYFCVGLWQVRRLAKISKAVTENVELAPPRETHELDPAKLPIQLTAAPSVTEHTTRTLEPIPSNAKK